MIQVTDLIIYPVKSLQGIHVPSANVLEKGFEYDRRWMIVDAQNQFITQRTHPHLSQIEVSLKDGKIRLSHQNSSTTLDFHAEGAQEEVQIWNDQVQGILAIGENNEWITEVLGEPGAFVYFPEDNQRKIKPSRARNGESVSLADGYPYLIIGEESLADLNGRLEVALPMNRFRPNIVVKGSEPYAEDAWRDMRIGEVTFYGTHPCKRCVFTTIDQETGEKSAEPLKTLATYRRDGNEIIFGLNALAASSGKVNVGDVLELL